MCEDEVADLLPGSGNGSRESKTSKNRNDSTEITQDGGGRNSRTDPQTVEAIFRSLTAQRRRYILYELQDEKVSDLDALAAAITAMEQARPPAEVAEDDVDSMKSNLVHTDIPLLADAGFVEYDPRSEMVRYSDPPPLLGRILRLCADIDSTPDRTC